MKIAKVALHDYLNYVACYLFIIFKFTHYFSLFIYLYMLLIFQAFSCTSNNLSNGFLTDSRYPLLT